MRIWISAPVHTRAAIIKGSAVSACNITSRRNNCPAAVSRRTLRKLTIEASKLSLKPGSYKHLTILENIYITCC